MNTERLVMRVATHRKNGMSIAQIAEAEGISKNAVNRRIRLAKDMRLLSERPRVSAHTRRNEIYDKGRCLGSMSRVLNGLDDKVRVWLIEQIPPEAPLSDVVIGIINDAYAEEME